MRGNVQVLPKHLRQHFFNVYAYCRISDDLGDEVGDTKKALALLDIWQEELDATYLSLVQPPLKEVRCDVERLQAADLKQISTVEAIFVYNAAMRDQMMPRKPLPDPAGEEKKRAPLEGIFPNAAPAAPTSEKQ